MTALHDEHLPGVALHRLNVECKLCNLPGIALQELLRQLLPLLPRLMPLRPRTTTATTTGAAATATTTAAMMNTCEAERKNSLAKKKSSFSNWFIPMIVGSVYLLGPIYFFVIVFSGEGKHLELARKAKKLREFQVRAKYYATARKQ